MGTSGSTANRSTANPTVSPFKNEDGMKWDPNPKNVDYNAILFNNFFPCVKGKAQVLDEFLRRPGRGSYRLKVERDKIRFHRPDADDPDELVSMLVMLPYTFIIHMCMMTKQ